MGYAAEWTFDGAVKDNKISFPFPITHRPRLGARMIVRQYVRRYITGLYKEITDWLVLSRERSSNLILFSIIYSEDYMVQFLDNLLVSLYKVVLEKENKIIMTNVPKALTLLGRYCLPSQYRSLVMDAIRNELASFYSYTQAGSLRSLGYLFEGSCELIFDASQFERVQELLNDFMHYTRTQLVLQLDMELAELLIETLQRILQVLTNKLIMKIDPSALISEHLQDVVEVALKCLAVFQNYRL